MNDTTPCRLAALLDRAAEGIGALLGAANVLTDLGNPRVAAQLKVHADALTEAVIACNVAMRAAEGVPE